MELSILELKWSQANGKLKTEIVMKRKDKIDGIQEWTYLKNGAGGWSGTTFLVGSEKPHAVYEKTKPSAEKGS